MVDSWFVDETAAQLRENRCAIDVVDANLVIDFSVVFRAPRWSRVLNQSARVSVQTGRATELSFPRGVPLALNPHN